MHNILTFIDENGRFNDKMHILGLYIWHDNGVALYNKTYKMKINLSIIFLLLPIFFFSQPQDFFSEEILINEHIGGTLLKPNGADKIPLVIIIGDSGPTDRDGNQNFLKNNVLKKLAEGLTKNGIATFRYDKRTVKQVRRGNLNSNIKFEDFVKDAKDVITYFLKIKDNNYSEIALIGHGQGSLVAMLAADNKISKMISIGGSGMSFDKVILNQIELTAPHLVEPSKVVLEKLRNGETTTIYPQAMASIFDISIQPFMSSWIKYDPIDLVSSLQIPVLFVSGTKDLQVSVQETELLQEAAPNSEKKIIENMNHIMFIIEGDDLENSKSYNEGYRKISQELLDSVSRFINN